MQIQCIQKSTNLVYVWVFFPVFVNLDENILHEIEHKLFFNTDLIELLGGDFFLSRNFIEANGSAYYSGIRLEFSLIPELLPKLLLVIKKITKNSLPDWTKEEAARFRKELDEDDSFLKLALLYQKNCLGFGKNKKDISAEEIWKTRFDFKNTRVLIVGNIKEVLCIQNWKKQTTSNSKTDFCEQKFVDWYAPVENYNYNVFFAVEATAKNYVLLKIMQNIFYEDLTKQYVKTGRAYEINLKNYFENNCMFSGFDIDTSDKTIEKPKFISKISKAYFQTILQQSIFEELSDDDVQAYGCFPIMGFMPEEVMNIFHSITYNQFCGFYSQKLKEVTVYWC